MSDHTDSQPTSRALEGLRIRRAYSDWELHVSGCASCKTHGVICGTEEALRETLLSIRQVQR